MIGLIAKDHIFTVVAIFLRTRYSISCVLNYNE